MKIKFKGQFTIEVTDERMEVVWSSMLYYAGDKCNIKKSREIGALNEKDLLRQRSY